MSTTRVLLPRPAASYAPHVVAAVVIPEKLLSSCTSGSRHCGIPTTRVVDGVGRQESRRRRTTCDRVGGVAPASLRWATMVAYIWIILKQPKASSHIKWYTRISWPVHRPRRVSGRYACVLYPTRAIRACCAWSRFFVTHFSGIFHRSPSHVSLAHFRYIFPYLSPFDFVSFCLSAFLSRYI